MTALHTQGPLEAFDNAGPRMQSYAQTSGLHGVGDNRLKLIAGCFKDIGGEEVAAANARRLAACWNAFEGVETAMVECYTASRDWPLIEQLRTEMAAARDLLADAIEAFDEFPAEDHEIADRIRTFLGPKS